MKYIYILGLISLILICILYNHKIKEGNSNFTPENERIDLSKNVILDDKIETYKKVDDKFIGDVNVLEEKRPSDYHIKQKKCNELKICDQLNKDEYKNCGYCLADEMDLSKPYSFHYGNKGGAYSRNSKCYHGGDKYTESGGVPKRNVEWVAPESTNSNTNIDFNSFKKCKEIKTKYTCEKQKQCNFMKGLESNIDKELNCGWCLDKTNDVGGNSYVRNLSKDINDLKDIEANYVERIVPGGIEKHYYCSNNVSRQEGKDNLSSKNDILTGDYPDNTKCKSSQIEKEDWQTIEFPKFESKHGKKCGKDLIKQSDCGIFLKESCMKKIYNSETGKEEEGPFITKKDDCIEDLWKDIGFEEDNFEKFKNGKYITEKGEEIQEYEITQYMNTWRSSKNFGEIQKSMVEMANEKIHSTDFYTAKKWNKILLNKNVCSEAFDITEEHEIKPNTDIKCVNPCYQYQLDETEWENTPKECQVKLFNRNGGRENGLVHPINQMGKMPSVLQFFKGSNIRDGFTTRDISKVSIIEDGEKLLSLNEESLGKKSINKINSIYENIKKNISSEVSFEKKYKAHLQLKGEAPSELENKLCWVEFVKLMRTYPGTKIGDTYQHITINDIMKNKLGNIGFMDNSKKGDKIVESYLKIIKQIGNNWILEKKTYEDPGFDFRPWNKVLNDYWKEASNWNEFMHLMVNQGNVKLHLVDEIRDGGKIEISEKSPFYNLINRDTCTYTKNMFLLKFDVTNLGSGATLYIKNNNYQQKEELSNGENEILLHPNLYNGTNIELIPLVKSILFIENATLIRIRDKKHIYDLNDYKKTSSCDNVWNYCYWNSNFVLDNGETNNTNLTPRNSDVPGPKYLLEHHRELIDFTKFFALISNDDFINLRYKSLDPEIQKSKPEIYNEIRNHKNTIIRTLTPTNTRKDTNFELNITARDQNFGWRTSKIVLEDDNSNTTTFGIGGKYQSGTRNGIYYNKKVRASNDNVTKISSDITNDIVEQKKNGAKVKMDLKYYTGYRSHETYIDKANLSVKNTPDNKTNNINLLNGIPGNMIKVKGIIQKKRKIPDQLKWVTIINGKPQIDDSYTYNLDGRGADQGEGHSSSKIYGSDLSKHRAKNQVFNWRNNNPENKKNRKLNERWENINLSGKINQHNTDKTIKIESETSNSGGRETYIKDLNLKVLKNNKQLGNLSLNNKKISINGDISKDLRQDTNITIWEGFQNNKPIENIIIDKLDNIKNYFFPEKEGFFNFFWPKKKKKKRNPWRFIFKPMLRNGAKITFKGKDQGWGNDCNAHLSINGKKSPKFGHKWKSYKINFDEKINKTNNTMNVKLHKYGWRGCEVHVKDTKIQIKNPQRSVKIYNIGNHSVTNQSGGETVWDKGDIIA